MRENVSTDATPSLTYVSGCDRYQQRDFQVFSLGSRTHGLASFFCSRLNRFHSVGVIGLACKLV
jgi:hypothetical protein